MPDIFAYNDFRTYLRDWFEWKKGINPRFSYRVLGEKVGFRSPGFFTQILQGKSNMSLEMIHRFATCIGLDRRETDFFEALVLHEQSKTLVEEKRQLDRMLALRPEAVAKIERDRCEFLEAWHHTVVWQLLETIETKDDPEELANALVPSISVEEARESLALLERLGMARRDANGRWRQLDPILSVSSSVPRNVTRRFYLSLNKLAADAHDRFERDERNLSWVTLAISDAKREEILQEIRAFRRHLLELARRDTSPQDVHQLLIQFFPLSRTRARRGKA